MTDTLARVTDCLARLCRRAGVEPTDTTRAVAERVLGVLRRTGCVGRTDLAEELHLPGRCPVAVWVRLEAAVPWEYAVCVSGAVKIQFACWRPGRVAILSEPVPTGERLVPARRQVWVVELPWVVSRAVSLVDESLGLGEDLAAETEAA